MAPKNSIPLSPTHGVNPALLACPLCNRDTGVALCGRLPNDAEAPRRMQDQTPCDECQGHMATGIVLVEARQDAEGMTFLGGYWVISEDAARRLFAEPKVAQVLTHRAAYIEPEVAQALGLRDHSPEP